MTRFIADLTYVGHVLLSPLKSVTAAESLHMAFAASELMIADVEPFFDLTHPRAGQLCGKAHLERRQAEKCTHTVPCAIERGRIAT